MTTTTGPEVHGFQAETRELLDLMIHSLYTHREIFLRELISNSSDALDKRRVLALTDSALRGDDEPEIRLEPDPTARTLVVEDTGIGMTRDEVVQNIGTIARSGTKAFVQELRRTRSEAAGGDAPQLIGQFGVGFYSCFMVAERVVLETRRAGSDTGVRWISSGDGQFTVEDIVKDRVGTRITLHLRAVESDGEAGRESAQDFTDTGTLREIVKRYSDFVAYPVRMDVEVTEGEGGARKKVKRTQTLNSMKPLWTRARSELKEAEYHEFYRHLTHDWKAPLATIHFRGEGAHEYTALMFLPTDRPREIFDPTQHHSRLSLYVRRIFVMQECAELLPTWLRFVRGLVDSADLPLNVSRETLQHNRQMGQIRTRLVKKVVETFGQLLRDDRARYGRFWTGLGPVIKEGLFLDDDMRAELAGVCLFQSSAGQPPSLDDADEEEAVEGSAGAGNADTRAGTQAGTASTAEGGSASAGAAPCPGGYTTLAEYVARMPLSQSAIYYVTGPSRAAVERSPHIEAARAKGYEVLFFVDPVDEWVLQRLTSWEGRVLKSLDRGEGGLEDEAAASSRGARQAELAPLLEAARESLEDYVKEVRLSSRLRTSPAVLVSEEGALSPQLLQALRASGQKVPESKRILELNPTHPVLTELKRLQSDDAARFHLYLELLHGQALLAEGSPVPDPARFARLVTELMAPGSLERETSGEAGPGAGKRGSEGAAG